MLPAMAQIVLFWGPDYIALYNDAYAPTIGDKHPRALGRPAREHWAELWDDLEPLLRSVRETGETLFAKDRPFHIERHGYPETAYFDISYSAVPGESGGVGGVLCIVSETTERVLGERRVRESEARFHAMADSIDQMIWSTTPDGFHDYYNRRWYEYTGVPEGSTDGEAWNGMFHPDDQERAWGVWRHSLETGEPYHIEYRLRHRSGDYRWVLGRAQPVRDETGAIARWYGTCTDIHDFKLAEEALRESEARFRALADSAPAPVWVTGPDGIEFANRALVEFFGRPAEDLIGTGWTGFVHPEDLPEILARREAAWEGTGVYEFTARFRHAAGDWRWLKASLKPRRDPPGAIVGFVGMALDVTDAKQAEQALRESEARFRAMADSAPAPVWVTGPDGIEFANRAFEEVAGIPAEQLTGEFWMGMIHPDELAGVLEMRAEAWAARSDYGYEARFRNAAGDYRWMHVACRGRFDGDGVLIGYVGLAVDIDDARNSEAQLREDKRSLETLNRIGASLAPELDLDKVVQMVTDAGVELTGRPVRRLLLQCAERCRRELHALRPLGRRPRRISTNSRCRATRRCSRRPSAAKASSAPTTSRRIRATATARPIAACPKGICRSPPISPCR